MRIGIDIRPLQETEPSGVSEYTHELLRALFSIDTKNRYHLFANAKKEAALPVFDFPHVAIHSFRSPNKLLNARLRFLRRPNIDTLLPGIDLFFMPNLNFACFSKDIPLVITAHDLSFSLYPSFFSRKQQLWHTLIQPKKLLQRATRIIAVSEHTKNDLVTHYALSSEKIQTIHPGISSIFFEEADAQKDDTIQAKYDLPSNFVLFLSTIEPRKNPDAIIEVCQWLKDDPRLADMHLVMVGKQTMRFPKSRHVHFLGWVPKEDRPSLYRLARVFVYPSYYEGFGLPPLEAMSQGTPVIASHTSSLGEVLGNAAILIDPHNLKDLKMALVEVLKDQKLSDKLATRGREHAKQFTWPRAAHELLKQFQHVAEQ